MEKLCSEYAIDPRAICSYRDFKYIFEKFGFSQGRLIVKIPTDWSEELLRSCPDLLDRQRIAERLKKAGGRRVVDARNIGGQHVANWLMHVAAVHERAQLAGAVTDEPTAPAQSLPPIVRFADCDEEFLPEVGEVAIRRNADEIAEIARPLFRNSSRVVIVDPYFNISSRKWQKSLAKLIHVAREEQCEYIDVVAPDKSINRETAGRELSRPMESVYGGDKRKPLVKFVFVPTDSPSAAFHHRFLLSDFGAIRYDAGVAAEGDELLSDVILVRQSRHEELVNRYFHRTDIDAESFIWEWPPRARGFNFRSRR
jgi:hypothetical protein